MIQTLVDCAGAWDGTSVLHIGTQHSSRSTLRITAVVQGRFVRIDYTWSYEEKPQEGSLLAGFDAQTGQATGCWVDTFHTGNTMMIFRDATPELSRWALKGSYAAPTGPDWGWVIELLPNPQGPFQIRMYNVEPASDPELAVDAVYHRTS